MNFKKGVAYVFLANVINLLISLFTGFVLPKLLVIETYSTIKLFQLYITYIGILHLGFIDGMYLNYGGKTIEQLNKKEVLSEFETFKVFQLVITIIAIVFSIFLKNEMLLFCSLVVLPINIGSYIRSLYQAIGEFKRYSRFTNINTVSIFIINIILLLIVKSNNYHTYIISYILAYAVYWALLEKENRKLFGKEETKISISYLRKNIKMGFFLMIGNFCNVIFTSIDRIFIQNLLGKIKFAFYSFAVSIENLMNVFITPISTVMYNYLCNNNEKEKVLNIKRIILLLSALIISVVFPAKFIIDVWLTKYSESLNVLFLLFASQYISIMVRCVHVNLFKAEKKQNTYFVIMLGIVVFSILANIILFSIQGSMEMIALATLITNIIWFLIGEIKFVKYRLKIKEYVSTFGILILFLLCSIIDNAIWGFLIYIAITTIITLIIWTDTLKYCMNEIKLNYKKIIYKVVKH